MADHPTITPADLATDLAARLAHVRALREAATPGRMRLAMMDPERDPVDVFAEHLSHGSGHVYGVLAVDHPKTIGGEEERPEHGVVTCWTGNGPTSIANAEFYIAAHNICDLLERYAARLAEVEQERDQYRADSVALRRAEGALVAAGPGDTGSVEAGILELAAERDRLAAELAEARRVLALSADTMRDAAKMDLRGLSIESDLDEAIKAADAVASGNGGTDE